MSAEAAIAVEEQKAQVMGANDVEVGVFVAIRKALRARKISEAEAIRQARAVVAGKADYH
ncbi:MAG: hypothetical protein RLZZ283_25 [Candidatus Parcubacteria bacterium]|jgi:hypothetical protein